MRRTEVQKLGHGLYRIHWLGDTRTSIAAVGSNSKGQRWLAPTNWISISHETAFSTKAWSQVERVVKLTAHDGDIDERALVEEVVNDPELTLDIDVDRNGYVVFTTRKELSWWKRFCSRFFVNIRWEKFNGR